MSAYLISFAAEHGNHCLLAALVPRNGGRLVLARWDESNGLRAPERCGVSARQSDAV